MAGTTIILDSVGKYNELFGLPSIHPLVSVVDLAKATKWIDEFTVNYGVYALFLKDAHCGDIIYGRRTYDYQEGTIVGFAPGQTTSVSSQPGHRMLAHGVLFHPDLISGTSLGREIRKYSFFSYSINEALHVSDDERKIVLECFSMIERELKHDSDRHSLHLIRSNIRLLLDYCMRFYERQFETREESDKDVIVRFQALLDDYFDSGLSASEGLPTVRYFADKVFLSANYFGDMVRKTTGRTASELIQMKLIECAKDLLLSTNKTMSDIAYSLGFKYPQHLSRMFKRMTGYTPNEFRTNGVSGIVE